MDRYQHDSISTLLRIIADRLDDSVSGGSTLDDLNNTIGGVSTTIEGVMGLDSSARDAFSRYRVSHPTTLFDSKLLFDKAPLLWEEVIASGSGIASAWSKPQASVTFTSTASTACNFIRRTYQRFNYQPGKSNLVDMTFVAGTPRTGRQFLAGQFDEANGFFFRDNAGTYEWVIRTSRSGSPQENAKAKGSWNIDNIDGSGPSGITLDGTQNQIIIIDYQWLGIGRVRVGFDIDGKLYYAHEFNHANTTSGVYMSTPNLPLTFQLITTAATPQTSVECICSTIISEGGTNDIGILRYESTNGTHVNADVADTWYPVIGIRLKTTHIGATVKLQSMSMLCESQDSFEWAIVMNPTVTGSPTWANLANSCLQTCIGSSTITVSWDTGIWFTGGVVKGSANTGSVESELGNAVSLGSEYDGTVDEIYLCCRPLTTLADIEATLSWREIQ